MTRRTAEQENTKGDAMTAEKSEKKPGDSFSAILAALVITILVAVAILGMTSLKPSGKKNDTKGVPDNPRQSATIWLTELMGKTSKKFGADMFNGNNKQFKQLMDGDVSFIPADIRDSVQVGEKSDDMKIPRELLTGSAYAGLIMYSTAYKNTKDTKTPVPGYTMTSYDPESHTVYVPARAIMLTNQPIDFAVRWDGSGWKLQGDPIAWDVYAMLEDSSAAASSQPQQEGKQ